MKLAEVSYREYLAMEVYPLFVGTAPDDEAAWRAFNAADAFLKRAGKEYRKVEEQRERAEKAETTVSVLLNMDKDFASRVALLQLWEMLGAKDQTQAAAKVRQLLGTGQ